MKFATYLVPLVVLTLIIGIMRDADASTFVVDWVGEETLGENSWMWADENYGDLTYGRNDFGMEEFKAATGSQFVLRFTHAKNRKSEVESWGLWFNNGKSGENEREEPIKNPDKDYHLLNKSFNNMKTKEFKLTKNWIENALSNNNKEWFFILRETTNGTGNTLKIDKAELIVTSTPVPGTVWLLSSGLIGILGLRSKIFLKKFTA